MTNYRRGYDFERECLKDLRGRGWLAERTAGSHGVADIWATAKGEKTLFVQCKRDGALRPKEWNQLIEFAEIGGGIPILASKVRGGIKWVLLTDKKDGKGGAQPCINYEPRRIDGN